MPDKIAGFQGEHRWLSNFEIGSVPVVVEGIRYPTVEHAYQAQKTTDPALRRMFLTGPSLCLSYALQIPAANVALAQMMGVVWVVHAWAISKPSWSEEARAGLLRHFMQGVILCWICPGFVAIAKLLGFASM